MSNSRQYWVLFCFFGSLNAFAQLVSDEVYEDRQNFGIKMGCGMHSIYGGKLQNPKPMIGYVAGFYWHGNAEKKSKYSWQIGIDMRLRGSNFANAKKGDTSINKAYTKLGISSVDIPLMVNYRLSKQQEKNQKCLQLGVQLAYIFNSVVYVGPQKIPYQQEEYLRKWDKLSLKPIEIQGLLGYQYRGPVMGYQISVKYGLNSLNNNFILKGVSPTTDPQLEPKGRSQRIGTCSLEFALIF